MNTSPPDHVTSLTFPTDGTNISTHFTGGGEQTWREGIYEFDLSALTNVASVNAATLRLMTFGSTSGENGFPEDTSELEFFAYTGNGIIDDDPNVFTNTDLDNYPCAPHGTGTGSCMNGVHPDHAVTPMIEFGPDTLDPNNGTVMSFPFNNFTPLQDVLNDPNSNFLTVRSWTNDFFLFRVHRLKASRHPAKTPATLLSTIQSNSRSTLWPPIPVARSGICRVTARSTT